MWTYKRQTGSLTVGGAQYCSERRPLRSQLSLHSSLSLELDPIPGPHYWETLQSPPDHLDIQRELRIHGHMEATEITERLHKCTILNTAQLTVLLCGGDSLIAERSVTHRSVCTDMNEVLGILVEINQH